MVKKLSEVTIYMKRLSGIYPQTYTACSKLLEYRKKHRSRELIPFDNIITLLESGYSDESIAPFVESSGVIKMLMRVHNPELLKNFKVLEAMKKVGFEGAQRMFYWINELRWLDTLTVAHIFKEIDWKIGTEYDMKHICTKDIAYLKKALEIVNRTCETCIIFPHIMSEGFTVYLEFLKRGLDTELIQPYFKILDADDISMYIHTLRNSQKEFTETLEVIMRNPWMPYSMANITAKYPKIFQYRSVNEIKTFNRDILTVCEIYAYRTGKVLTDADIKNCKILMRHLLMHKYEKGYDAGKKLGIGELLILNYILHGQDLLTYLDMKLSPEEIVNLCYTSINYTEIYKKCMDLNIISLRDRAYADLRKRIIQGKNH